LTFHELRFILSEVDRGENCQKDRRLAGTAINVSPIFLINHNLIFLFFPPVFAPCDTMGGPVIKAAKMALETDNVNNEGNPQ